MLTRRHGYTLVQLLALLALLAVTSVPLLPAICGDARPAGSPALARSQVHLERQAIPV